MAGRCPGAYRPLTKTMWIKNYVDVSTSRARASPKTEARLNKNYVGDKNYVEDWRSVQNIDLLNKIKCPGFPRRSMKIEALSNKKYVDDKNYVDFDSALDKKYE